MIVPSDWWRIHPDCVLVMSSLRQLRPGVTVVRLGRLDPRRYRPTGRRESERRPRGIFARIGAQGATTPHLTTPPK
jgi:hypothetical protein